LDEEYVARIKEEIFDEIKTREVLSPSILDSQQVLALFSPETLLESIACSSRRNAHIIMQRALETPGVILGGKPELTESILMLMVANRDHASMFVRMVMSMRSEDVIVTVDVLTEALRNYLHTRALLELLPLPSFGVTFLSSRIVSLAARREPLGLSDFFGYLSRWAKEGNLGQDQSKALFRLTQIYLDAEFGRESQKSLLFQRYCTKLEASPQVTRPGEEATEEGDAPRPLTVLVADDHPVSRLVLEGVLDDLGCQTTSASNGAEALTHLIGDVKFDIAFLEPRLPRISGADVAQMARRGSKTQRINTDTPLIAVTAHENEFVKGEGFDALLLKPATRRNVIELLTLYCRWKPRHVPETVSVPSQTEYGGDTFMDKDGMEEMLETGRVFLEAGKYHEAEASLNIVINNPLIMHPQGSAWIKHPQRIQASFGLARLYLLQQRYLESEELGREVVKLTTEVLGEDDEDLFDRQIVLAIALKARRKDLEAAKLLANALDVRRKHLGADAQTTELTTLLHQWNEDTYPSTERSTAVEYEAKALVEEHRELLRQLPFSRRRKARDEDGPSSSFAQRA
jgi:CheY-like chemotaxis protein